MVEAILQIPQFSLTILIHILIRGKIMKPAFESLETKKVKCNRIVSTTMWTIIKSIRFKHSRSYYFKSKW